MLYKLIINLQNNTIKNKSFEFSVRIVNLYKLMISEQKEFILSKQLLRSGTSIGANIREGLNAESSMDFIHKFSLAQKECDETLYWIELLKETKYLNEKEFISIYSDATELLKIIKSIIITSKNKVKNNNS